MRELNARAVLTGFCCRLQVLVVALLGTAVSHATADESWVLDARFAGFDPIHEIAAAYPQLSHGAETISHFAGLHRINPFLLAEVVQWDQSQTDTAADATTLDALGAAVARAVHERTGKSEATTRTKLAQALSAGLGVGQTDAMAMLSASSRHTEALGIGMTKQLVEDGPPALDLPFDHSRQWRFSGAHHCSGARFAEPMSSLDFGAPGARFGEDLSDDWVAAAHDGVATVYSSCFVQITHPSGWQTNYYHVANIQVQSGDQVTAGTHISNNANTRDAALCQGGAITYPHTHFDLLKNGECQSLAGVTLSGYAVHPGRFSFDDSPDHMWLEKRGEKHYAFGAPIGHEPGDNLVDYRYNGMWAAEEYAGHGLNVSIAQVVGDDGETRNVLFVALFTYDDDGDATFYVGNIDFERWRVDETMTVDMIQTRGGDLSNLSSVDFALDAQPAGTLSIRFMSCRHARVTFTLDERRSGHSVSHEIDAYKLGNDHDQVCSSPSLVVP